MDLSVYDRLLEIARQQLEAANRGDFTQSAELVEARERLLHEAPPPQLRDREAIREVLRIDVDLSTAFRRQMIAIRDELLGAQHARVALQGYRPRLRHSALALDAAR